MTYGIGGFVLGWLCGCWYMRGQALAAFNRYLIKPSGKPFVDG